MLSMTSVLDVPRVLLGNQRPRLSSVPPYVSTSGPEAVELAAAAGLYLDGWQQDTLTDGLGERPDGKWASLQVGVEVTRQNGKGALLEARELAGLFLLGERLIIHSAHQFDTSLEAFGRLLGLIEDHPPFSRRVKKVSNSHGQEGITLKNGQRIRFRTRTKGGGRGFTCDCLILDEAMDIPESAHAATFPTLSARPNPQVWYTGSAVDQEVDDNGVVFARIREAGLREAPGVAWFEWSCDMQLDKLDRDRVADPEEWAIANPALGIRISPDYVAKELAALGYHKFAVERLGVGNWPAVDPDAERIIPLALWKAAADQHSGIPKNNPVCFAIDVSPGGEYSAIAAAGDGADGRAHIAVINHDRGTAWVVDRMAQLKRKERPAHIVLDPRSPAGALVGDLEAALGIEVTKVTAGDQAAGFGIFLAKLGDDALRHRGTLELQAAVDGADKRPVGDEAYALSRKNSAVDISPLVAAIEALWAHVALPKKPKVRVINLNNI